MQGSDWSWHLLIGRQNGGLSQLHGNKQEKEKEEKRTRKTKPCIFFAPNTLARFSPRPTRVTSLH
jgi:hypothetical protein